MESELSNFNRIVKGAVQDYPIWKAISLILHVHPWQAMACQLHIFQQTTVMHGAV